MTNIEKPFDSPLRGLSAAHRLPGLAAIKSAVLLALLIAYGLGFAALYALVQTSAAKSAAEGNDPALFVGL
jgi:hypothetical protein